jgi:hypothetical protein
MPVIGFESAHEIVENDPMFRIPRAKMSPFKIGQSQAEAVYFGLGGKARLVSVPRSSASAACSALSSFACLGM